MSANQNSTVRAVQDTLTNLKELVEESASGQQVEEVNVLLEEANETVLALIAAIVVSDQKYEAGEQAFFSVLANSQGNPREVQILREYAERWRTMGRQVPRFFKNALAYDASNKTGTAPSMMREIQLAGNNACISDGQFADVEHEVVRDYLALLDEYVETWKPPQNPPGA